MARNPEMARTSGSPTVGAPLLGSPEVSTMGRNRRRAHRYEIALPVELLDASGTTRNISESGVLFETDVTLSPGDTLEFALVFGELDPAGPFRVHCSGRIVRVEPGRQRPAVAIKLEQYAF